MSKTIKCPHCGKPSVYDASNPSRPFCSERCQLMDLGKWADEKYAVPGEAVDSKSDVNENPERESDEEDASSDNRLH